MSRKLQESKQPYEFAITNHRKAARLFDEQLSPPGPVGPLEQPDSNIHDTHVFEEFCLSRQKAYEEHVKLIIHLASDVGRHVLPSDERKPFIHSAEAIIMEDFSDSDKIQKYSKSVFSSTIRAL